MTYRVLVMVLSTVAACAGRASVAAPDSAQAFVNAFYGWYRSGAGGNMENAVAARPELLDSTLLRALREDFAASAASPGEIVGLDFDPFVASQDPCEQYVAEHSSERNGRVEVPVTEYCNGQRKRTPAVTAELVRHGNTWQIANLLYDDSSNVLSILRQLKSSRLSGDWDVEFRLDSTRTAGTPWHVASGATARGTLHLSDSTGTDAGRVRSSIHVDFTPLLGHPMSCADPSPTETLVQQTDSTVSLNFTPQGADCGFSAFGVMHGDSIVGSWSNQTFAGPTALGLFRATRHP